VQYAYDDGSVVVVNGTLRDRRGLKVTARVLDTASKELATRASPVDAAADSSTKVFQLPEPAGATPTYFVFLRLDDAAGRTVSRNVYWLSTKKDTLEWDKSKWYYTPQSGYADFTALEQLPPADITATARFASGTARVTLRNPSKSLAFLVHLAVRKGPGGDEVLPVLWEDNYVVLLPGETRAITARYAPGDLGGVTPVVSVDGWNIREVVAK